MNDKSLNLDQLKELSNEQFETLYKISQTLNSAELQDSLIENVIDLILKVLKADRAVFVKYNSERNNYEIIAARNIKKENIHDPTEFSSGILQQVTRSKQPILYHDVKSDPAISGFESLQIHNIKSVIGVPVFNNERIWGIILADSSTNRREFNDSNLLFLNFFSNLVSLALDRIIDLEKLKDENRVLLKELQQSDKIPDIVGESKVMVELSKMVNKVAATDVTVLILGESGTGKDLVARAIHKIGDRKDKPFVAQFCGSIPESLLESELFGYKKGAFTGANNDKKGLLEVADKGTLFLDEIADISPSVQANLLRVIENREIIRVGDTTIRKVDIRLIAATNKDLKELVSEGKFRDDLFYRLNVFPIKLPPLRERRGDMPLLAKHFIRQLGKGKYSIEASAIKKLESYYWPGNVRQLLNVLNRSIILCESNRITEKDIIFENENEDSNVALSGSGTLKELEKLLLLKRLDEYNGNRTLTARSLGVSVRWVQLKLKEIEKNSLNEK
jgi:Nif-specific regulatory protein